MAYKAVKKAVQNRIVDDVGEIWKRWSTWLMTLLITAQATWALVPDEARQLLPQPQYLGLGLGAAALIATMLKQGTKNDGEDQ